MADVFLSYSREDEEAARLIAEGLAGAGLSVFWDRAIPPGQNWHEVLELEMSKARAVVVLWSHSSKESGWVKEEAQNGADRNCLIPVLIDSTKPPLGFGRYQALQLDLSARSVQSTLFTALVESILALPLPGDVSKIVAGDAPPFKLSERASPQRLVLAAVASSARTSLDVLKRNVSLSESTIVEALNALESQGYVQRHAIPSKGTRFSATPRGRSLLASS